MSSPERAPAFDFLINLHNTRLFSELPLLNWGDDRIALRFVLNFLKRKDLSVYAVDVYRQYRMDLSACQ
jgi:hypothetical protein